MGKLLLTGVDGNLGNQAAEYLLDLVEKDQLVFCAYSEAALKKYADLGIETHVTNFNHKDGLAEAFANADKVALISMPFVGAKRQNAHKMWWMPPKKLAFSKSSTLHWSTRLMNPTQASKKSTISSLKTT